MRRDNRGPSLEGLTEFKKKVALHRRDTRALHLLECGFRTSIIQVETGLSAGRIRDLYHGLSGLAGDDVRLRSGQLQESAAILRTRASNAEGTIFILIYTQLAGHEEAKRCVVIDAVIRAHRLLTDERQRFGAVFNSQPLDINRCWVLARDYRTPSEAIQAVLQLRKCSCGAPYLVVSQQHNRLTCPFCSMSSGGTTESDSAEDRDAQVAS